MNAIFKVTIAVASVVCLHAQATQPLAPCGPKTKGKIAALDKLSVGYLAKVSSYKKKSPVGGEGRMPASYCGESKSGLKAAALLAKEGVTLAEELEGIEKSVGGECPALANPVRLKFETAYLDLNKTYIQSCLRENASF